jgi:agmatine/peptidylarginine deiminase
MSRRLPAEWEPQSGVMLTWPHIHSDWAAHLSEAEATYIQLTQAICQYERVLIVCYDQAHQGQVSRQLEATACNLDNVHFAVAPGNDTWARDYGPISVEEDGKHLRLLDFGFNGWGGKYTADRDNAMNQTLARQQVWGEHPMQTIPLVLEGGSIDSDGQGTLLTTKSCLLTSSRNPDQDQGQIEQALMAHLGCQRVLWLSHGQLEGDDTDGHIDTLARFINPETIAHVSCLDKQDPHYALLQAMEDELKALRTQDDKPYQLVPLPLPAPKRDGHGRRLPATYANFLIINGAVLAPTYRDPLDENILRLLGECFPGRDIIGIDSLPLIRQNGSLHCITMQLPAGILV